MAVEDEHVADPREGGTIRDDAGEADLLVPVVDAEARSTPRSSGGPAARRSRRPTRSRRGTRSWRRRRAAPGSVETEYGSRRHSTPPGTRVHGPASPVSWSGARPPVQPTTGAPDRGASRRAARRPRRRPSPRRPQQVAPIVGRVVDEALQPRPERREPLDLAAGDRLERLGAVRDRPQRDEVVEAERRVDDRLGPGRVAGPRHAAGPARSRPRSRPGRRRGTAAASGRRRAGVRSERPRRTERRRAAARAAGRASRRRGSTSRGCRPARAGRPGPARATWRRQKPWVRSSDSRNGMSSTRSAMIESSIARSERARTAQTGQPPERERVGQAHVDEVLRRQARMAASRRASAGRPDGERIDGPDVAIGRPEAEDPRRSRSAPRDRGSRDAVERVDRGRAPPRSPRPGSRRWPPAAGRPGPGGDGPVRRRARAARRRPTATASPTTVAAADRGRDDAADTCAPSSRAAATSAWPSPASTGAMTRGASARPVPGRGRSTVSRIVGARRRFAVRSRRRPCRRRQRIPPASVARLPEQPRHERAADRAGRRRERGLGRPAAPCRAPAPRSARRRRSRGSGA